MIRSKYGVRMDTAGKLKRTEDGILFHSEGECNRYKELKLMERARIITNLEIQPSYPIVWPGTDKKICTVKLDFRYVDGEGITHIEDYKGPTTALSSLKRKLVENAHNITVELIRR